MSDLAQQILDAIGRVEQTAFDATKGPWEWHAFGNAALVHPMRISTGQFAHPLNVLKCSKEDWPPGRADREHIALNAPDVVLRRCVADREIVELHIRIWLEPGAPEFNDAHLTSEPLPVCASCRPETMFRRAESWPCRTLLALARGYGIQP